MLLRSLRQALQALVAVLLLCAGAVLAQALLPVPALTARVIDETGTLSAAERSALEEQLAGFESRSGPQIVVLMVPTTAPEDIAAYAHRIADSWKIGRREVGDGLLVVVAKNDRRIRIETARALEGAVPDLAARQIIDRAIGPRFKEGDYAGGLRAGIEQLIARIEGEHLPLPDARRAQSRKAGLQWEELAMFLFVGVPVLGGMLVAMMGRKLGSAVTGAAVGGVAWWLSTSLLLAGAAGVVALVLVGLLGVGTGRGSRGGGMPIIWGGGGGGRGWGGGGGGFSSGGGGSFGGGGASGGW